MYYCTFLLKAMKLSMHRTSFKSVRRNIDYFLTLDLVVAISAFKISGSYFELDEELETTTMKKRI